MPLCECGCHKTTVRGQFLRGHDQTLRADLERRVGGLLALRQLVESAESVFYDNADTDQHIGCIRRIFLSRP
jgi:hypothetical protein